jgi:glucose/arabinose dehydrogenase
MEFEQPFDNHNGGQLLFGPKDKQLYIATGDGGGGGDPFNNGQNRSTILGKILRINPTTNNATQAGYTIPGGNPYADRSLGLSPEIWHYGLRNPWRFTFDRKTGDMYIGDVGQDRFEEIDFATNGAKGINFGWNRKEGFVCYPSGAFPCAIAGLEDPIIAVWHPVARSVTGGYLYRGKAIPSLKGKYIFGDFITQAIFQAAFDSGTSRWYTWVLLPFTGKSIASFGETQSGELLVVDIVGGAVYRLVPV